MKSLVNATFGPIKESFSNTYNDGCWVMYNLIVIVYLSLPHKLYTFIHQLHYQKNHNERRRLEYLLANEEPAAIGTADTP